MQDSGMDYGDFKKRRLKDSLTVFHLLFAAMLILEPPWKVQFYDDNAGMLFGDIVASYVFYLFPFAIWHSGDAIQRRPIKTSVMSWLVDYRFALSCFVAKMLWGLAYAVDIVDVPGAHEFGTLNFYGIFISVALSILAAFAAFSKLAVAIATIFKANDS